MPENEKPCGAQPQGFTKSDHTPAKMKGHQMHDEHIHASHAGSNTCAPPVQDIISAVLDTGLTTSAKALVIKLLVTAVDGRGRFRTSDVMLWATLKDRQSVPRILEDVTSSGIVDITSKVRGSTFYFAYAIQPSYVMKWCVQNRREQPQDASGKRRRERIEKAGGRYTPDDVWRIDRLQKGRCAACKKKRKLTVDHIVPVSAGGSSNPRNLQLLCHPCNSSKYTRDPIDFMQISMGVLL